MASKGTSWLHGWVGRTWRRCGHPLTFCQAGDVARTPNSCHCHGAQGGPELFSSSRRDAKRALLRFAARFLDRPSKLPLVVSTRSSNRQVTTQHRSINQDSFSKHVRSGQPKRRPGSTTQSSGKNTSVSWAVRFNSIVIPFSREMMLMSDE